MDQVRSLIFSYLLFTVYFTTLSVPRRRRLDMGRTGKVFEGNRHSVTGEKYRRLAADGGSPGQKFAKTRYKARTARI